MIFLALYDVILFDLDGTLTDSKIGITKSAQYALSKFNIIEDDLDKLEPFIGPPLTESFMEFYNFTLDEAKQAIGYYREYFKDKGIFENKPYDGIEDMLKDLKKAGCDLAVATSKPTVFSERILKHFNIDGYFEFIAGSELDGTRVKKADVIEYAISQLHCTKKEKIVMVGDRKHDVLGAKANKIDCISVLYGYGSIRELKEAGPKYIVNTVQRLKELLLREIF
ncbi:MAG TPA: phosphoglycolate phosphatase [Clostridiaceae bacterium]|nr:phosphoglycolate phosphatase [Clostridiaceae bacterium]